MMPLALIFAVICLAPLGLYLVGKIRDPFHPLILAGTLAYFVSGHRMFTERAELLELMPSSVYAVYLLAGIISILGMYFGWWYAGKRAQRKERHGQIPQPREYHAGQLMMAAFLVAIVATTVHFVFYEQWDVSGYLKDLKMLWITGAILSVQCIITSPRTRVWAILVLLLALAPPVDRFLVYGQRGDTFRMATLVTVGYLTVRRRPSKPVFLAAAVLLALVLGTLHLTRNIVNDGEATNRFTALAEVIPHYLKPTVIVLETSEEQIFGASAIEAVRHTKRYGYGLNLTIGFVFHLLPHELFPGKYEYLGGRGLFNGDAITEYTGLTIPTGAAPSGITSGFYELAWFCPLVWAVMGFYYRKIWDLAIRNSDLMYQGLFAGYSMAVLYAISQDFLTAEVNVMYIMLPLPLIYRFARRSTTPSQVQLTAMQLEPAA